MFRSLNSGDRESLFQENESRAKIGKPDDLKKSMQDSKTVIVT